MLQRVRRLPGDRGHVGGDRREPGEPGPRGVSREERAVAPGLGLVVLIQAADLKMLGAAEVAPV